MTNPDEKLFEDAIGRYLVEQGGYLVCKVGPHAFIAGGAIVTRDVPNYVMVAGNPAVVVKQL